MININEAINTVENKFNKKVIGISETNDGFICLIPNDFVVVNKNNKSLKHIGTAEFVHMVDTGETTKLEKPDLAIKRREEAS